MLGRPRCDGEPGRTGDRALPLARIAGTLLFFVHVPKTGGTSIEAYMRAKGAVALAGTRRHGWSRTTPQHIQRELFQDMVPPEFYDHGFVVLRDPKARLLSEFRMRVEPLQPQVPPPRLVAHGPQPRPRRSDPRGAPRQPPRVSRLRRLGKAHLRRVPPGSVHPGQPHPPAARVRRPPPPHLPLRGRNRPGSTARAPASTNTGTPPLEDSFHQRRSTPLPVNAAAPPTRSSTTSSGPRDHALIAELAARTHA